MISCLTDTRDFVASLERSLASLPSGWRDLLDSQREVIITRAPGRLDLMGGIGDYSGALVLQWPIQSAVHIALQRQTERILRIASLPETRATNPRLFEISLEELISDYSNVHARFSRDPANHWAAYIAGAVTILGRERNVSFKGGAHLLIKSAVPEGKGVSSSAALEVASMWALSEGYELKIPAPELALLCQKVENLIVGAPCGVMDQMTAACGEANRLLELLCQPAELKGTLPLPAELEVWGVDSGTRHFVGGADYRTVRTAAFMGYRIIADAAGLQVTAIDDAGHLVIEDQRWNGYLANIGTDEFEREYVRHLPPRMSGREFLDRYHGVTDSISSVDEAVEYPVLAATRHPIYETERVTVFGEILRNWNADKDAIKLGELMYQSHESYSSCGLGSDGTDQLVALVKGSRAAGLYGAKITGGGSGGTVAVLGRRGAGDAVRQIAARYQEKSGNQAAVISGSSSGASLVGSLRIENLGKVTTDELSGITSNFGGA